MKKMKTITVNMTDEEFLDLAKEAHAQDITFNQLVNNMLSEFLINTLSVLAELNHEPTQVEKKQSVRRGSEHTVSGRARTTRKKARR